MSEALGDLPYLEWTDPDSGELVRLYSDVWIDEAPILGAVATDHPVEQGATITDHYRKTPEEFRVTMYFSGTPLRGDLDPDNPGAVQTFQLPQGDYSGTGAPIYTPGGIFNAAEKGISAGINLITGGGASAPTSFQALAFSNDPRARFKTILDQIRHLQLNGILLTASSSMGTFDNMAIMSFEPHRSADLNDGMQVTIDMKELIFVSSDITFGAPLPKEPRAIPKKSATGGTGSEVSAGPKKTALRGLVTGAGS